MFLAVPLTTAAAAESHENETRTLIVNQIILGDWKACALKLAHRPAQMCNNITWVKRQRGVGNDHVIEAFLRLEQPIQIAASVAQILIRIFFGGSGE